MMATFIEAALRSLLLAIAVWAELRVCNVRNVLAQKAAWIAVLLSALLMPAVLPLAARWQVLPEKMLVLPARWQRAESALGIGTAASPAAQAVAEPVAGAPQLDAPQVAWFLGNPPAAAPKHRAARKEAVAAPAISEESGAAFNSAPMSAPPLPARPASVLRSIPLAMIFAGLYLLVTAALLLRLVYGIVTALRLWHAARPAKIDRALSRHANLRVRFSSKVSSPVTIGSGVLLPADYAAWDDAKLRVVLAHEQSHVKQRDFYWQMLAALYAALVWFSPLGWWLKRKLSDLGETIGDRAGLNEARDRTSYAQILLEFAAAPQTTLIGVAMARPSSTSRRIERLLNKQLFRQAFAGGRRTFLLALVAPAALFAFTAMVRVEAATLAPEVVVQQARQTDAAVVPAPADQNAASTTVRAHLPALPEMALVSLYELIAPPAPAPAAKPAAAQAQAPNPAPAPTPSAAPAPAAPQAPRAPSIHVNVPAVHVDVPAKHIDIPAIHVDMPAKHIDVPAIHVDVPAQHIDIPAIHVDVPEQHFDVPAVHVDVPDVHVDVPAVHVDVPPGPGASNMRDYKHSYGFGETLLAMLGGDGRGMGIGRVANDGRGMIEAQPGLTFDRTLTINGKLTLSVATASGNIHLTHSSGNQVVIHGQVRARDGADDAQARAIAANPPIEQDGNTIRIGAQHQESTNHISVDYEIEAPADAALVATTGSGNIVDEGVGAGAKLTSGSGNITATGLEGGFTTQTGSGNIAVNDAGAGDAKAQTGSGDIAVKGVHGALKAQTGSGRIDASGTPSADWKLQAGSGSIELSTGNAPMTLDAETGSGKISAGQQAAAQNSPDHHHLRAQLNGGGPEVKIETGSGDIRVD